MGLFPHFIFALDFCDDKNIGKAAVYANGRVKPFLVHAYDRMMLISDDKKEVIKNGVKNYCELSFGDKERFLGEIRLKIYHNEIKEALGLEKQRKIEYISIAKFLNQREAIFNLSKQSPDKRLIETLNAYMEKVTVIEKILSGQDFKIFVDNQWAYPFENNNIDQIKNVLLNERNHLTPKVYFEYLNSISRPFFVSIIILLLGAIIFVVGKSKGIVIFASLMSLTIQLLLMIIRGYVADRIPFSNMYETVMLAGFIANVLGIIFYFKWKEKFILITGLLLNIFTLFMLEFSTGMLDASINPLMPVLKNNFWLGVHVFTVMISYAAFGLSWFLSNIFIVRDIFKEREPGITGKFSNIISDTLRFGVVFLSAGILTGGMWADFAWGRFWGWDPKEVWSLIVLLVYMIILHGRYTNWINKTKFIFITAPAFLSVMMAWFGVNYVLATGLHSYGFSQGGTIFFAIFVGLQLMLSVFHGIKCNYL